VIDNPKVKINEILAGIIEPGGTQNLSVITIICGTAF